MESWWIAFNYMIHDVAATTSISFETNSIAPLERFSRHLTAAAVTFQYGIWRRTSSMLSAGSKAQLERSAARLFYCEISFILVIFSD